MNKFGVRFALVTILATLAVALSYLTVAAGTVKLTFTFSLRISPALPDFAPPASTRRLISMVCS